MSGGLLEVIGGIGLFLLGMTVMTDGLNRLAGNSLRRKLGAFTKTPSMGAITGAIATVLVQSSSATTVMAVGFVGAGLLTFPQALGVIFGANIGSTATGWIVALGGFTFSLKYVALPMLFIGALLRLSQMKRLASIGSVVAGFGAVFIGISMLQSGMEAYHDAFTPERFPPDTLLGRFLLLLIGLGITLVTQSSAAGVAAAITAVHVGNISLTQAAAMVIGMDVGTTVTALLASLGGNVNARRTGLSHVVYNLITGTGAFVFLPVYMQGLRALIPSLEHSNPELALVAFHTLFNSLGVLFVLPVTQPFAKLIMALVPSKAHALTERLEPSLLKQPQVAIENVVVTLRVISEAVFSSLAKLLESKEASSSTLSRIDEASQALDETRIYVGSINDPIAVQEGFKKKVEALHILDHLARLIARIRKQDRLEYARSEKAFDQFIERLTPILERKLFDAEKTLETNRELNQLWLEIDRQSDRYRHEAIESTVKGKVRDEELTAKLDSMRWLQRVTQHASRITHYLSGQASLTDHEETGTALENEQE